MSDILPRRGDYDCLIIDDPYSSEPLTPEAQAQLLKWYEGISGFPDEMVTKAQGRE